MKEVISECIKYLVDALECHLLEVVNTFKCIGNDDFLKDYYKANLEFLESIKGGEGNDIV